MAHKFGVRKIANSREKHDDEITKMEKTFNTLTEARKYLYKRIKTERSKADSIGGTWCIFEFSNSKGSYVFPNGDAMSKGLYIGWMWRTVIPPSRVRIQGYGGVKFQPANTHITGRPFGTWYVNSDGTLGAKDIV